MRPAESAYWDEQANKKAKYISDNVWKRAAILHRVFTVDWYQRRVLEIGVGFGTVAAVLRVAYLDNFTYTGTEVSPIFVQKAREFFDVELVNTDILGLPETKGGYNRVIALDSLEHVCPGDRLKGYMRLRDVLADNVTMFINMPMEETEHDLEFDHPFTLDDVNQICTVTGLRMIKYEEYDIFMSHNGKTRTYGWVVLQRGNGG